MNKFLVSVILAGLVATSFADTGAQSCDESDWTAERGFAAAGDLLVVRPLGTAATIAGFGIFAVASPFAAMAGATDEVFETLVENPGDYTFKRDLGDFSK